MTNGEKKNLQQSNSFFKPFFSFFPSASNTEVLQRAAPAPYTEQMQRWRTATRRRRHNVPWDGGILNYVARISFFFLLANCICDSRVTHNKDSQAVLQINKQKKILYRKKYITKNLENKTPTKNKKKKKIGHLLKLG